MTDNIFDLRILLDDIPAGGTIRNVDANPDQRARLAGEFGLLELNGFKAVFNFPVKRGPGFVVEGEIEADLVQACVTTLEPVPSVMKESFRLTFLPSGAVPEPVRDGDDFLIDLEGDDPPEPLTMRAIDLGEIVVEQFAISLDPYPRAPRAEIDEDAACGDERVSPFAALEALRSKKAEN